MNKTNKIKTGYIEKGMRVNPWRVLLGAVKALNFQQPVIVIGVDKDDELYVASSASGAVTNSMMSRAMRFLKIG